jgi:hypothetical protein
MKHTKRRRPSLPAISEEMKAWSTALADEVGRWPQVDTRLFFGFTALYRGDKMFAALPRTRGIEAANSLAFKLETPASSVSTRLQRDARIRNWSKPMQEARWFTFEISSHSDLHDALDWLGRAYAAAGKRKKSR